MPEPNPPSLWARFWHAPVRAERLALMRILLGVALLSDQLLQYLPHLEEFYGATGVAPSGLHDWFQLKNWRWSVLLFNTDDPTGVACWFWTWVGFTAAFTLGLFTRVSGVGVWFLTYCFINRNPNTNNGGDDVLQLVVFLLMLAPCGKALSLDAWWRRARTGEAGPAYTAPWAIRLIQIQLCVIYLSTGLVKLRGVGWDADLGWFNSTWWDGTSIHYVLNDVTMSRRSFAEMQLPFWLTATMTYSSVAWETLFTPLVLWRRTRWLALWFGVAFHVGIWLSIEVGWFSWYTLTLYAVWVPDWFWEHRDRHTSRPL